MKLLCECAIIRLKYVTLRTCRLIKNYLEEHLDFRKKLAHMNFVFLFWKAETSYVYLVIASDTFSVKVVA